MGHKTHPIGFRLGINKPWNSRWFAPARNFADLVHEDMMIKRYISKRLDNAGIAKVLISRAPKRVTVDIHTSRPGIVIGRRGAEVDKLREELQLLTKKAILLNIVEVRKPELSSQLVADSVARQLEGRMSFRRSMKKALAATMKMGAQGIKIQCGGRLGGAEIARTEKYMDGRVPLHTLRADIDYATSTAHTTYGTIGVKVWICLGDIMGKGAFYRDEEEKKKTEEPETPMAAAARGRRERPERGRGAGQPRGRVRRPGARPGAPMGRRPDDEAAAGAASAAGADSKSSSPSTEGAPRDTRPQRPRPRRNFPPRSGGARKIETKPEGKPPAEDKG